MKASEIAALVGGVMEGGADPDLTGVAPLDRAASHELSFLASSRYLAYVPRAEAGAILLAESLKAEADFTGPRIIVADVHRALAALLPRLYPEPEPEPGVHSTAVIERGARVAESATVAPYAVIARNARVGERVRVGAHTVVGPECVLGDDVVLHPHVTLYARVRIGARSIVHAGVRIGVDGFGYANEQGRHHKIPQVGGCDIGTDVEIGANTTIDRGSVGATEIGNGVKIDNLVHIGHNVRIGDGSIVVAQVGVAGSTRIGEGVTLAGQAGIQGHVSIGDGATVGGQAGVFGDVPPGAKYSGYPARPHRESLRAQAALFRLPEVLQRLRRLEHRLSRDNDERE